MDLATAPTAILFKQWRGGDGASGQAMAQRFSDWYYAITTCRLGDEIGTEPLRRACVRFQQGILGVTTAADLTDWAHGVLMEEVRMAGGRIAGGDFANQLTGGRSPSELIVSACTPSNIAELRLLAAAYDSSLPLDQVKADAERMGGYPLAVLQARLALKRALRDRAQVTFSEVPDSPNLDLAPLPLYEAGRMEKEADETGFEKWMLSDMKLCKDIAEFGVFAQALRAGALRARAAASAGARSSGATLAPRPVDAPTLDGEDDGPSTAAKLGIPLALLAVAGLGLFLVVGAGLLYFFVL
ncbi:MAG: hypothetical protein FJ102_07365 [Deltaproteobacteria bacterium]|nr:hypothetical protein [Deltaproteobacteria bacterium]